MGGYQRAESVAQTKVKLQDSFWTKYEKMVREVAIPYQWEALNDNVESSEPSHAIKNFRIASGIEQGEFYGLVFQDSDVYKWLEGVSLSLFNMPDKHLEALADQTIDLIGRAQQPDGYLNTYFTIKEPGKRWTNLHDCHELYCAGHLIEAAVAYSRATGKAKLLNIACKFADHIDSMFGPEPQKLKGYPGHQEIELSLIKLYKVTENRRYLNLCKYFIEQRGQLPYYFDEEWEKRGRTNHWNATDQNPPSKSSEYNQSHLPVKKQEKAVGHAVRAVYMYTAMAELAAEIDDEELFQACRKIWDNIQDTQTYITGGIGSTSIGEAFTFDYNLPNDTVYAETCASIGLIFFANRMLHLDIRGKYADIMEKALYNAIIGSVAMDGKHFFYVNPLEVWPEACGKDPIKFHVKPVRQSWFGCACCPPNLVRLIESLGSYIYSYNHETVFVNLYIGSKAEISLDGKELRLIQDTSYPWGGTVDFEVNLENSLEFTLALRLPEWCTGAKVKVNVEEIDTSMHINNGYILIKRAWKNKDTVSLELDMPVQIISAHPQVRADAGKVAIQRGPIVYCIEEADNGNNLSAISIDLASEWSIEYDDALFSGTVVIEGKGKRIDEREWENQLYKPFKYIEREINIKAIPYFLWGNRGEGEMMVWIRHN